MKQLEKDFSRRSVFNQDLETLLTTRTRGSSAGVAALTTQSGQDTSEVALRELEQKTGEISREKLWKEILDHFKCNLEKANVISLSTTAASTLAAASLNLERDQHKTAKQPSRASVIVFTCEHSFPSVQFMEMILPEFEKRMNELPRKLPHFVERLYLRYQQRDGVYPTSCPVCVYNFLREEQLRDHQLMTEGKPPEPWGI